MSKTDKYPYLDPCEPGIFDRILMAVTEMRKEQRSPEWMQAAKRKEQERGDMLKLKERESKERESRMAEEAWQARIRALPSFGAGIPKL